MLALPFTDALEFVTTHMLPTPGKATDLSMCAGAVSAVAKQELSDFLHSQPGPSAVAARQQPMHEQGWA
jgi:hypothetical protein